MDNVLILLIKI